MEVKIRDKMVLFSWEQKKQLLVSFLFAFYLGIASFFLIWFRKTQGIKREVEMSILTENGKKIGEETWLEIIFSFEEQVIFFSLILILSLIPVFCGKILVKKKIFQKIDLYTLVAIYLLTCAIILVIGLILGVSIESYFDPGYYPL